MSNNGEYYFGSDRLLHRLGRAEGDVGVPDLTWEKVTKTNLGFDVGLLANSITLSVDLFKERRSDIFMKTNKMFLPKAGFINAAWSNYGKVDK